MGLYEVFCVDGESLKVLFHDYMCAKSKDGANRKAAVMASKSGVDVDAKYLSWKVIHVMDVEVPEDED